jgi:hypothetical protein
VVDRTLFWTGADLAMKLVEFQGYYNEHRVHSALNGQPPASTPDRDVPRARLDAYRWQPHCRGLYHTPIAA